MAALAQQGPMAGKMQQKQKVLFTQSKYHPYFSLAIGLNSEVRVVGVSECVERVQDTVGARIGDGEAAHRAQEVSEIEVDILRSAAGRYPAEVDGAGFHLEMGR